MRPLTHQDCIKKIETLQDELASMQKEYEQAELVKKRLARLLNNLHGMAYKCTLDENLNRELVFVSKGAVDLLGIQPEAFIANHRNELELMTHPEDLPRVLEIQQTAIEEKGAYNFSYRVKPPGEIEWKWMWDQGEYVEPSLTEPACLEGIIVDISWQKTREAELRQENERLHSTLGERYKFGRIVGKCEKMRNVFRFIMRAAQSTAPVIVFGETGTGKELVAECIHNQSGLPGDFVPVNCGAIPENLMESEFFGSKKGAYSGSVDDRKGYLAAADQGTLFLDEVGEIPLSLQVRLLRALETKTYTPIGSPKLCESNFRLVAATHKDLAAMVKNGTMREDFYYRLNVLPVTLPSLRDRREDIPLLIDELLLRLTNRQTPPELPSHVRMILEQYDWPGNVRELQNVLERYLVFGNLDFLSKWKATEPCDSQGPTALFTEGSDAGSMAQAIAATEEYMLRATLARNNWHKGRTALELGLTMRTMQRKLKRYGLSVGQAAPDNQRMIS